ncbi:response regulator [Endozoicomonas sp. SM1973]|uniref:histidine kinase n=1 Tax=Spartinivicinus marinus TaxID=2994442 RepID=A0A853I383_9GAMM|nr:ATP-binding protein [Spartinivicinus marinus]MCX4027063.1 ATP-binding protein [Spartinivicinus marinus]NYZ67059.1 response regulator [Spartinivicinus marinus]
MLRLLLREKRNTVGYSLIKAVFGVYVIIAVVTTVFQLATQYNDEKNNINSDLVKYTNIFSPVLTQALWHLNNEQVYSTLLGIIQIPVVVGVELTNAEQQLIGIVGNTELATNTQLVVNVDGVEASLSVNKNTLKTLFNYQLPLVDNQNQLLGYLTLYSSTQVVLERVEYSFILLIVNGVIKTVALLIIIVFFAEKLLGKPLKVLIRTTRAINFESLDNFKLETGNKSNNELKELEVGFCNMVGRLKEELNNRKLIEGKLVYEKIRAEKASQAKSQFLANMSHEIRTPLNSIIGFSQILALRFDKNKVNSELKKFVLNIKSSGEHLIELINNILDLSKIEVGRMDVHYEDINIKLLVQGIFHINKIAAYNKELDYSYQFKGTLPDLIRSDRTKLNQILTNVISNAIKFTPNYKSVKIITYIKKENLSDSIIAFKVEDEGIGISKDKQKEIFKSFQQADNSITRNYGGTGLGLAITSKLVSLLGGTISVESEPGRGSTFEVKIPYIATVDMATVDKEQKHPQKTETSLLFSKENKVLVVEDIILNQEVMKAMFEDFGLAVDCVNSGQAAIDKVMESQLKSDSYDLIIMDMHMPEMSGLDATRAIRQILKEKKVPIVALSAEAFCEQQQRALDAGVDDYLTKPISIEQLAEVLHKYLKHLDNSNININSSKHDTDSIPDKIKEKIKTSLVELEKISIYKTDILLSCLDDLKEICKPFNTPLNEILSKAEVAVLNTDNDNLQNLLLKTSQFKL